MTAVAVVAARLRDAAGVAGRNLTHQVWDGAGIPRAVRLSGGHEAAAHRAADALEGAGHEFRHQ